MHDDDVNSSQSLYDSTDTLPEGETSPAKTEGPDGWYVSQDGPSLLSPAAGTDSTHTTPPNPAAGSSLNPNPGDGADKKRLRRAVTKAVTLTACAFLLLFACYMAFGGTDATEAPAISLPDIFSSGGDGSGGGPDEYGDYRDFFDNYYTADTGDSTDIPAAETGTGVQLALSPRPAQELTLQEIYAQCSEAVVGVVARVDGTDYSWGTGIILTEDGYVITNYHVIEGTNSVAVVLTGSDEYYDALLVGGDSDSDIAVLKIDARGLTAAQFGDSSLMSVGDRVVAIGNPLGSEFSGTMTDGIVSAIDRDMDYNGHTMTLLQTNAAINEGNSGGPLINMYGQVIGITNMKMMGYYSSIEGIGFAIPTASMKAVVDELIEKGHLTGQPVIGIVAGGIPPEAKTQYDLPDGVYVSSVDPRSDAGEKGLQEGDIILSVNGVQVATVSDVNAVKDGLQVGDTLDLEVYRDGETFPLSIALMDKNELS